MKNIIVLIFIICFSAVVYSQNSILDRFTLRQSFQSKNDNAEPAVITFTKPKDKNESWLLNAAIGFDLLKNTKLVLSIYPYVEYHKNTLIDKEQDNWQTGISTYWQICDLSKKRWSPIIISAIKYNEDKIKQNTSFQGNIYLTPLFKGKALKAKYFWIPNNTVNFGKFIQFVYTPYIGLENENRIKTANNSSSGNIYRCYLRITSNFSLFPKSERLKGKFEFSLDWQYRYNFIKTVQEQKKSEHRFFTASFNYIFYTSADERKSAKIGIDYTDGENPTKSFEEQSFWAFSLKVKL